MQTKKTPVSTDVFSAYKVIYTVVVLRSRKWN
jgi:hypothetical protein